jgi:hypothetical protein
MKRIFALPLVIALSIFSSCQKQQTEEERTAEIDRRVQEQLDAEHRVQEKEQLAQREGELDAREKSLTEKEKAAAKSRAAEVRTARPEQRTTQIDERRPTASYDTFYTKLEPYGAWRETSDYGFVWQPRDAEGSRNWRPYTNGRWVYTDVGWTWVSEEPFGWATYHYGRWTRLRNIGWVWVPGDEWAPAWVSWRTSNDYVGWAPLPPEARFDRRTGIHNWADSYYDIGPDQYCFVPTNQFGGERAERAVVAADRNLTIVNQTTNVTNITYNNTTIVNQGPSYDEMRTRSTQPIERLRLERRINFNIDIENLRAVVKGQVIEIPGPVIAKAQPAERPRNVRETIGQTIVDHGWDQIADRQAADKVRVKIKAEASPPSEAPPRTFVKPAQAVGETATAPPRSTSAVTPSPSEAPSATPEVSAPVRPTATPFRRVAPETTPVATPRPTFTPRPAATSSPSLSPRSTATPSPVPSASATTDQSASPAVEPPRVGGKLRSLRKLMDDRGKAEIKEGALATPAGAAAPASASPNSTPGRRMTRPDLQTPPPAESSLPSASSSPSATSTPAASVSVSPFLYDKRESRKERKNRKREMERVPDESKISPSPTLTPAER